MATQNDTARFSDLEARLAAINCQLLEDDSDDANRYYILDMRIGIVGQSALSAGEAGSSESQSYAAYQVRVSARKFAHRSMLVIAGPRSVSRPWATSAAITPSTRYATRAIDRRG
jgi:hypothetical protein